MPSPSAAYLFMELAILSYLLGFCWEHLRFQDVASSAIARVAVLLGAFWFTLDQIAIGLGLWTFPANGSLGLRLFALPLEEYLLFILHTFLCLVLINQYSPEQK